jgi:hypothetical protein
MKRSSTFGLRLFTSAFLILFTFAQPLLAIESLVPVQDAASTVDKSKDILDEGISDPEEIAKPTWMTSGESATTSSPVVVGETYTYPINPAVTVTFSKLPSVSSSLTIKTIYLTDEQVKTTNAASDVAYDISTDMVDGTFEYDLTLPKVGENTGVVYAENVSGLADAKDISNVVENGSLLKVENLNHFTVFVVVDDGDVNFSAPGWSTHGSGYNGDHAWVTSSFAGSDATWTYTGTPITGGAAIFVSWTQWSDHATNAMYTSPLFSSFEVNQKLDSTQSVTDGNGVWSGWYRVPGSFTNIPTGTTVTLGVQSGITNGNLSADAVAFVDLNEAPITVWVDDNYSINNAGYHFWGYDAFNNIQSALAAVANGGVINIANGTYIENGQIVVNKNVSIIGESRDSVVIKPNANTGNSGDSRGWVLVNAGKEFNLKNVTLDGAGKLISIGILSHGTGVIENNLIQNMEYNASGPDYAGRAIALYDTTGTVINNVVKNYGRIGIYTYGSTTNVIVNGNTIVGKGVGEHLDYGIEVEGGAFVTANNNVISNNSGTAYGTWGSAGVLVTTLFSPGATIILNNNTINDNSLGIALGYTTGDTANAVLNANSFSGNFIDINNGTVNNVDARSTTSWSVIDQSNLNQIESKVAQNCEASPYAHGTCNGEDDYGTGYGFVQYKNIEVPTNLGWNLGSKSSTPNETPLDLVCSIDTVYTNENSVAQNWTGVSGLNVKYQREVTFPTGGISYFNAGSITNTPFATFGSSTGIEGLWKTRVRAYVDANLNNVPDNSEEVSAWSNYCNITLDKTRPTVSVVNPISDESFKDSVKIDISASDVQTGIQSVSMHIYKVVGIVKTLVTGCTSIPTVFDGINWTATINNGGSCNLSEGRYEIAAWAYDLAGNPNWASRVQFNVDTTAPSGSIDSLYYVVGTQDYTINNFKTNSNSPMFKGTYSDNIGVSNISITLNGLSQDLEFSNGTWTSPAFGQILPDGTYPVTLTLTDLAGNVTVVTKDVVIDTNAPTATYTHYNNGVEVLGAQAFVQSVNQLTFTGTYTDPTPSSELYWDSFVIFQAQDNGSFAFSQNGKQAYCSWRQNPNLVELSGNPFTLTTQRQFTDCVATLPEGTYYMTHQVYDNATRKDIPTINQFRDVLGLKFTVDTTAPVSQFTQNQANTYHNSSILLQGVSNDVNGVTGVSLYYKNTNSSNWILIETQTNTSNSTTFNWSKTWTPPYQGTFDVKAEATDQAGNTEHSPRMNRIVYDTTRPSFGNINIEEDYLSRYVNGYYGFTISVRTDDSLSGIKGSTCEYTLNGTTWTPGMFINDKCRFGVPSFILYDNQSLDIRVRVDDKAGNTKTSTVVERKVDKALPQSETMIANEYYGPNSLPFIHGTASDTVSRISDVKLTMRRNSDGKYWTGNSFWSYLPGTQDVLGTSHWVLTSSLPSMNNGVQYTVTPLAWDQVQDFPGVGIADSFIWDSEDPIDPAVSSTSHTSAPNRDRTIDIIFSGASDELSGVAGYFYSFTHTPETPSMGFFNWLPADATHITSRSLSDGTWYFNIRTVDKVGNITSTTHSIPFIIDTTAPTTPSIVSPTSEQYFKSTPILNDWTNATDVSGIASYRVEYKYDDGHTFSGAPYRTTTVSQRNHIPNSNEQGGVSFRVQAFDNAGNEGAWSSWVHYYYDTIAPSKPVITNTTEFTNVDAITINWTGGDDTAYVNSTGAGIAAYSIRYVFTPADGTPDIDWTSNWVSGGNPHTRFGSFGHGEGKYVIFVKTIDLAGNESPESDSYTVTYDKTTPVTTTSGIDSLWHNTDVTVNLTCDDASGSGCYKTYYSLNGETEQEGNSVVVSAEGLNTITFYSEDMAGNVETVQTSEVVKIDKTNPEAQVLSALSFQTGDTTQRSLALSDNNELAQVCYVIDTNTQTCLPLFGTGFSWDITALINTLSVGTHTFTYYVIDTAGNRSDSNTIVEGNDPYATNVVVAAVPQQAVRGAATVAATTPEAVQGAQTTEEETTSPVTQEEVKGTQDTTEEESIKKPIPWWVYAIGGTALLSFIIFLIARRRKEEEDKEKNIK